MFIRNMLIAYPIIDTQRTYLIMPFTWCFPICSPWNTYSTPLLLQKNVARINGDYSTTFNNTLIPTISADMDKYTP